MKLSDQIAKGLELFDTTQLKNGHFTANAAGVPVSLLSDIEQACALGCAKMATTHQLGYDGVDGVGYVPDPHSTYGDFHKEDIHALQAEIRPHITDGPHLSKTAKALRLGESVTLGSTIIVLNDHLGYTREQIVELLRAHNL